METITIKLERNLSDAINKAMKKHYYSTKTEFVREALREKLDSLENKPRKSKDIISELESSHHIF